MPPEPVTRMNTTALSPKVYRFVVWPIWFVVVPQLEQNLKERRLANLIEEAKAIARDLVEFLARRVTGARGKARR